MLTRSSNASTAARCSSVVIDVDQRMLGRQHHVRHAEAGVGPGGEDAIDAAGRRRASATASSNSRALGAADPVALHGLYPLGPVEVVEVVEQLVGVVGDAEEPLLEVALDDDVAGALARAVGQTCSLASTVWQPGHQLTGAFLR